MVFDRHAIDLNRLNSATKYPSIQTYHQLDPRDGSLLDDTVTLDGPVIGTEKIDGTNARIIVLPDGTWILGSREELLHAQGDLIANPAQGIAAALRDVADRIVAGELTDPLVYYLEVYGGKIGGGATHYTGHRAVSYRLFDVAVIPDFDEVLRWPVEKISTWREDNGQTWLDENHLAHLADNRRLPLTPRLFTLDGGQLPTALTDTRAFLAEHLPATLAAIDDRATGTAEGIVLRTPDRRTIAKARFADYDRTLRRRQATTRR
jgi:hypothetical protein